MRKICCFLLFAWTISAATVLSAEDPSALSELAVYPSLIVYNAKIHTMDRNLSSYEALALRGNRIWKLGSDDQIRKLAGPQTQLIDARGRAVVHHYRQGLLRSPGNRDQQHPNCADCY